MGDSAGESVELGVAVATGLVMGNANVGDCEIETPADTLDEGDAVPLGRRHGTRYRTGGRRRKDDIFPAMQGYARSPDFFNERFAARLKLFQIRRTKWLVSSVRKDQVSHLEIAYRAIYGVERVLISFAIRSEASPTLSLGPTSPTRAG